MMSLIHPVSGLTELTYAYASMHDLFNVLLSLTYTLSAFHTHSGQRLIALHLLLAHQSC